MACAISFFSGLSASPLMSAVDAVDGSSASIAMHHISVVIQDLRLSLFGTNQTNQPIGFYVRFRGGKADIGISYLFCPGLPCPVVREGLLMAPDTIKSCFVHVRATSGGTVARQTAFHIKACVQAGLDSQLNRDQHHLSECLHSGVRRTL